MKNRVLMIMATTHEMNDTELIDIATTWGNK